MAKGDYKLKPLRKEGDPIPEGEEPDSPEEQAELQKFAHVDAETAKDGIEGEKETEKAEEGGGGDPPTGTGLVPYQQPDADFDDIMPSRESLTNSYKRSLPEKLKAGISAFFSAVRDEKPLGHAVAPKHLGALVRKNPDDEDSILNAFRPKKVGLLKSVFRAVKPLAELAAVTAIGVAAGGAPVVLGVIFAAYYLNKFMEQEKEAGEREEEPARKKRNQPALASTLISISTDEKNEGVDSLVSDFMDWFGKLDHKELKQAYLDSKQIKSESASLRCILCPSLKFFQPEHHKRYLLVRGSEMYGTLNWDMALGDPDPNKYGWQATLRHGFNESSFHSGRDPDNAHSPFTIIHEGEVKLRNPSRLTVDLCHQWAKSVVRR